MCWFEAQRFRAYPLELFANIFGRIAEATLYGTFWIVVAQFTAPGSINPIDIIGYYMIITGLSPLFYTGFGIAGLTNDMIKSGALNQALIRPINPIIYPWALRTGRNAVDIVFGIIQVIIGVSITGGLQTEALPFLLPVLFNTAALNASFNILLGALGFYLTEGRGFKNAFLHLASFLRGEKMPIYLMQPAFIEILMLTPFPASIYHLAVTLKGTHLPEWQDVLVGSIWAVVLLFAAVRVWKTGLKKYEAIGI
jgi:ABC-2 type transport system permease protein